jgi:hypothetical protein
MTWTTRKTTISLLLATLAFALATGLNSANAQDSGQWFGPYSDGCYYFGDGVSFTLAGCHQADGTANYYIPDGYGSWVYAATGAWDAAGCFALWDATTMYSYVCPTSTIIIGGTSLYPDVTMTNAVPFDSTLSGWQPTGIWELDQFMLESQDQNIDIWLRPLCNEIHDYTCVEW